MSARRIALGCISALLLVLAGAIWFGRGYTDASAFLISVLARVGVVLFTVFLAWPVLEKHAHRMPVIIVATLAGLILFISVLPRLLPLAIVVALLLLAVHFGLRYASRMAGR